MIDALNDKLLTLAEAAKRLPSRPCVMSVFRWLKKGRLAGVKVGARWYTTEGALTDFIANCNTAAPQGTPPATAKQRQARVTKAKKELAKMGL